MEKNNGIKKQLNWAVLGVGVIANEMAEALAQTNRKVYAVGNRTYQKAVEFAEKYGIEKVYQDFHEMFSDPCVDIIYITTPHNTHLPFLKEALSHGKHVLCEKSITLNDKELAEARALAEKNHLLLAEAMTIYHMPLYKKLFSLAKEGKLGKISLIQANFGSFKEYNMQNRFFNKELAGGAMLDIGVYALSLARYFMQSKPEHFVSTVNFAETGVDEMSGLLLTNKEGQMAVISLSLHTKQPKRCIICGEKGYFEILEYPRAQEAVFVDAETGEREQIQAGETKRALQYELEDMENAVLHHNTEELHLTFTSDVMALMTAIRKQWGMFYKEEENTENNNC